MEQGLMLKKRIGQNIKSLFVLVACFMISACSTTSLKSYDSSTVVAEHEISVFVDVECSDIEFGYEKLTEANQKIKQAVSDYGFLVVEKEQADFILDFSCRKESDLNLNIVANEISGMLMVTSITLIPTYWPTELWVDMDVYDLRAFGIEKIDTFESSFVSQKRVVWAPFILLKLAYDFGLPKYNVEKFYTGLTSSTLNLLSQAETKAAFE